MSGSARSRTYAIVFACDTSYDGGIGKETKARCDAALAFREKMRSQSTHVVIVLAAGYHPTLHQRASLAHMMKNYMMSFGLSDKDFLVCDLRWGTFDEQGSALQAIDSDAAYSGVRPRVVYITSWYHIPRVMWLQFYMPGRFSFRAVPVRAGSPKMIVLEILALGGVLSGLRVKRKWKHDPTAPAPRRVLQNRSVPFFGCE